MKLRTRPYTFKKKGDENLFVQTRAELQLIFADLCLWLDENDLPSPIITSTIRGKMDWSISDTHAEGRAIDLRSWIYSLDEIGRMVNYINDKYAEKYGTSPEGKPIRCLVYEGNLGVNNHLHLQVRR